METFVEYLSWFFRWMLRSSEQACVLILIILALQLTLRHRLAPRWRHCLWLLLLVRLLMPWTPPSRISVFNLMPYPTQPDSADRAELAALADQVNPNPLLAPANNSPPISNETPPSEPITGTVFPESVSPEPVFPETADPMINPRQEVKTTFDLSAFTIKFLPWLWLAGALILFLYLGISNLRYWYRIKRQKPLTDQKILDLLEPCKQQMRIHTPLTIIATEEVSSPALFGFIRPRLLLPPGLINRLSIEQLRYVILHELAHLKRHDILLGWLSALLQVLHWFNPLIWLAFYRMRCDRELACDALVLSYMRPGESKHYGQTIVHLLEQFSQSRPRPGMVGILENQAHLKRRITMITQTKKTSKKRTLFALLLLVSLAVISLTDAVAQPQPQNPSQPLSAEQQTDEYITKSYDVGNLLSYVPSILNQSSLGANNERAFIYELVKRSVPPLTWADYSMGQTGKGVMVLQNDKLIVKQTQENHRIIEQLLKSFGESASTQISIEFLLLTLGSDQLTDIPLDPNFIRSLNEAAKSKPQQPSPFVLAGNLLKNEQVDFVKQYAREQTQDMRIDLPHLIALNGQMVTVSMGSTMPYITGLKDSTNPPTREPVVEYVDLSLTLSITPFISPDKKNVFFPTISINQNELRDMQILIARELVQNNPPVVQEVPILTQQIQKNWIITSAIIPDGATLLLGGLVKNAKENPPLETQNKITLILIKPKIIFTDEKTVVAQVLDPNFFSSAGFSKQMAQAQSMIMNPIRMMGGMGGGGFGGGDFGGGGLGGGMMGGMGMMGGGLGGLGINDPNFIRAGLIGGLGGRMRGDPNTIRSFGGIR